MGNLAIIEDHEYWANQLPGILDRWNQLTEIVQDYYKFDLAKTVSNGLSVRDQGTDVLLDLERDRIRPFVKDIKDIMGLDIQI